MNMKDVEESLSIMMIRPMKKPLDELKRNMSFSLKAKEMDIKWISSQLGKLKLPKDTD
jgi:hypothetical protein